MKTSADDVATLTAWLVADPIWLPDSSCSVAVTVAQGQGDRVMVGD